MSPRLSRALPLVALTLVLGASEVKADMAWNAPPDTITRLPADGGCERKPRGVTELDAWLLGRDGRPVKRMHQWHHPEGTWWGPRLWVRVFVTNDGRQVCSGYDAARWGVVVYGWRS